MFHCGFPYLFKSLTPRLLGMSSRFWILPAVLRLYVMDSAKVLILSRQLPQPGAPIHIIADSWVYPNVAAHALTFNFYVRDILQNIFTARFFPQHHIVFIGDSTACVVKVQAAVAALLTLESFWRHTISCLIFSQTTTRPYFSLMHCENERQGTFRVNPKAALFRSSLQVTEDIF